MVIRLSVYFLKTEQEVDETDINRKMFRGNQLDLMRRLGILDRAGSALNRTMGTRTNLDCSKPDTEPVLCGLRGGFVLA